MRSKHHSSGYYRAILDAMPAPVFVVDDRLQVFDFNEAAGPLVSEDRSLVLRQKGGEVWHCIQAARSSGGCGHSEACRECAIRTSVLPAFEGHRVHRRKVRMELQTSGGSREVDMLVTATPLEFQGERRVLLILEDVTELVALRGLLPICAACKSIRDDQQYWQQIESYLHTHLHLEFTHGLCPACTEKLYPGLYAKIASRSQAAVPTPPRT